MQKIKWLVVFLMVIGNVTAQNLYSSEKVYLSTDKDQYYPGDTMWIHASVFDATSHQFSKNKGIVYLLLKNSDGQNIKYHKGKVTDGSFRFFIPLAKKQTIGNYQLVSYTSAMKGDGEAFFSRKNIKVIPRIPVAEKRNTVKNTLSLLEFFPEGGNLVAGIDSKVGFRFNRTDSLAKSFEGIIIDKNGKEVAYFYNMYKGMGTFMFKPDFGMQYKAVYKYGNRKVEQDLPQVLQEGFVLSAENVVYNDGILVNIHSNKNVPEVVRLVAHQRGDKLLDIPYESVSSVHKFVLSDETIYYDGIVELYLINAENQIVCQRSVYYAKSKKRKIRFTNIKKSLLPKGKIEFDINLIDDNGNPIADAVLDVSVRDALHGKPMVDNNANMHSYLLVNADLEQPIIDIDPLFDMPTTISRQNFDLYMLSQKGRKTILENRPKSVEENEIEYIAQIYNGDSLLKDIQLDLFMEDKVSYSYKALQTDENGQSVFKGNWVDSVKVIVKKEGFDKLKVIIKDKEPIEVLQEKPVLKSVVNTPKPVNTAAANTKPGGQSGAIKPGVPTKPQAPVAKPATKNMELKEVVITGKQSKDLKNDYRRRSYNWEADIEIIPNSDSDADSVALNQFLTSKILWLSNSDFQLMIDGKFVPSKFTHLFTTGAVAQVDVINDIVKIKKISVSELPVVHILTKKDQTLEQKFKNVPAAFMGYSWEKEMYMPDYSKKGSTLKPDRRTSLLWKTGQKTDKNGKLKINFNNSDTSKSYHVTVSGIDSKGFPVYFSGLLK